MEALITAACALLVFMTLLYGASLFLKNNGVADVGYGIAFMVVIAAAVSYTGPVSGWYALLVALPYVWGARLAVRIGKKNFKKPEDFRYKAWRDQWGSTFWWRSYLQVYLLQGLVIFTVALPVTLAVAFPSGAVVAWLVYLGVALWLVGFFFEVVGDYQLDRFIGNPANKGKIMMSGLWKYSRHPNYFGESTMWWGIAIVSAGLSLYPLVGFLSPVLITYLLRYVSGVPMLEARWAGSPEWEAYAARTSVMLPWPPRSHGA